MSLTLNYILSQVLTVIIYINLGFSYFLRNRENILKINVFCDIISIVSFILLNGYTGAFMVVVITLRDLSLLLEEKKKIIKNEKSNFLLFMLFLVLIIILTIISYNGILSLFSVFGTIISTIAISQKDTMKYKMLSIISSILWLVYQIYLMSIMAIVLELFLQISAIIGYIRDLKHIKVVKNSNSLMYNI